LAGRGERESFAGLGARGGEDDAYLGSGSVGDGEEREEEEVVVVVDRVGDDEAGARRGGGGQTRN
jgi:hypothetical protein